MPTYEYQCESCDTLVEVFHGISEPGPRTCPACGQEGTMRKLISAGAGLIFKGSGFYITDYKRSAQKVEKDGSKAEASSTKKEAGKGDGKAEPKGASGTNPGKDTKPAKTA